MPCESQFRDIGVRTERQQILDLEYQLSEARGRLEDLKEWVGVHKNHHKDGESDCCAYISQQRRLQIRSALFTGLDTKFEDLPNSHPHFHSAAESVWRPDEEERIVFDQTGANADGLLLAVDKFLSSEDRALPAVQTSLLPGQASSD